MEKASISFKCASFKKANGKKINGYQFDSAKECADRRLFFFTTFFSFFFPSLLFSSVVCIEGWKCTRVMARGCLGECDGGRGGGGEGDVLSTREEKECVKHFS